MYLKVACSLWTTSNIFGTEKCFLTFHPSIIYLVSGSILQLGRMEINPIASLSRIGQDKSVSLQDTPSLMDIDSDNDEEDDQGTIFRFIEIIVLEFKV